MKTQQQKMIFYFITITIGMIFFSAANAQIVYTDVNPDQTYHCYSIGCSLEYSLDLNNDGIADFKIHTGENNCQEVDLASLNSNPLNTTKTKMNLNQVIDSNLAWASIDDQNLEKRYGHLCAGLKGNWNTSDDGYLGLKFKIGSQFFYGWARLSILITGSVSFTIKDYAYNSIPDQSILTGDTGSIATNIHHIKSFSSLAISPNSFQHLTRISFSLPQSEKTTVVIRDVTGRVIKILADEMMNAGPHELTWNARDENGNVVSPGIYFLQLQSSEFLQTEKLIVMK